MIIYKTTNKLNGKIYIGQDTKNNPKYLGSGTYLKRVIKKYGKENFSKKILQECNSIDELNDAEIYWIEKFDSTNKKIGYNITKGGLGCIGYRHTIEERKRMSYIIKNSPKAIAARNNLEIRERMKNTLKGNKCAKGYKHTVKSRKKMSTAKKGCAPWNKGLTGQTPWNKGKTGIYSTETLEKMRNNQPDRSGENNHFYGKKHSEETKLKMKKPRTQEFKEKMKLIAMKRKMSNETKLKISNKLKGKKRTSDTCKKISQAQNEKKKAVACYDIYGNLICIYNSLSEASFITKLFRGSIRNSCNSTNKFSGKYKWRFVNAKNT